jgi:modulator of FtsH protease HflK
MAHDHEHGHSHHHHEDDKLPELPLNEFDPGSKSLAEALRISFIVLKVIMILLVVVFIGSGFFTVDTSEKAIVLRLGKVRGVGEEAVLGPGPHWAMPHPVDEVIKIPVGKPQTLEINDFWYAAGQLDALGQPLPVPPDSPLLPQRDGYLITRNDRIEGLSSNDYNIVHCKWRLYYRISDPVAFFRNVYVQNAKPGEDFYDVAGKTVNPLLKSIADKAIVTAMVGYSIDQALASTDSIGVKAKELMSRELERMNLGVTVDSMQMSKVTWPRQVDAAFQDLIGAQQESQTAMNDAYGTAVETLNKAGGPVTGELLAKLKSGDAEGAEPLWNELAGEAQKVISEARAYKTTVVTNAEASARYMASLLPEYQKRPQLVMQKIYQDAIEEVMAAADEKIYAQRAPGTVGDEVRVMINSNPVKAKKAEPTK